MTDKLNLSLMEQLPEVVANQVDQKSLKTRPSTFSPRPRFSSR